MAKHQKKVQAGLKARVAGYTPTMPSGQSCKLPGSQNIKKSGTGHKGSR